VGTNGGSSEQHQRYVWPVGTATSTFAHVALKDAWDRAAEAGTVLRPAVVYDLEFGREGARAVNAAYRRLSGADIPGYRDPVNAGAWCTATRFCAVAPGGGSQADNVERLAAECERGARCNFLLLLLEPRSLLSWFATPGAPTLASDPDLVLGIALPPHALAPGLAQQCGAPCHGAWGWTGYRLPVGADAAHPAVRAYADNLARQHSGAEPANPHTEGAYLGVRLLVDALRRVGPVVTRDALARALDATTGFDTGLTLAPLTWRPGQHYANVTLHAYAIEVGGDGRVALAPARGPTADPWPGQDEVH
jgi:hypothetical protein